MRDGLTVRCMAIDTPSTRTTSFWHPFADMAAVSHAELLIERGEGVHVFDADGNRYLDGTASLWYANLGHGRPDITRAVAAQMDRLPRTRRSATSPTRRRTSLRAALRARADGRREGLPRLGRRRCDRHRGQDRPAPLDPARAARADAHHQPHQRLPRHARFGTSIGGIEANTVQLGPDDPAHLRGALDSLPALEQEILSVGPRARRRVLLRAGHRRRRRLPAPGGLHRGRRRPVRRARRSCSSSTP